MEITQHWYGKLTSLNNGVSECHGAPCWFTARMLADGQYAIALSSGVFVLIERVNNVYIDAGGRVWIDVTMMDEAEGQEMASELKNYYRADYKPQCIYAHGEVKTATVNAGAVQFAMEL